MNTATTQMETGMELTRPIMVVVVDTKVRSVQVAGPFTSVFAATRYADRYVERPDYIVKVTRASDPCGSDVT